MALANRRKVIHLISDVFSDAVAELDGYLKDPTYNDM